MFLNDCPVCGCKEMSEIPELGTRCSNCDEIFKYDEYYGIVPVRLEEWVDYLNTKVYEREISNWRSKYVY